MFGCFCPVRIAVFEWRFCDRFCLLERFSFVRLRNVLSLLSDLGNLFRGYLKYVRTLFRGKIRCYFGFRVAFLAHEFSLLAFSRISGSCVRVLALGAPYLCNVCKFSAVRVRISNKTISLKTPFVRHDGGTRCLDADVSLFRTYNIFVRLFSLIQLYFCRRRTLSFRISISE